MKQTAHPIETLEDLMHGVVNALTLISSHAQHLLGKREAAAADSDQLQVIYDEAQRAARLLGLVPRGLARSSIRPTGAGRDPAGDEGQEQSPMSTQQHRCPGHALPSTVMVVDDEQAVCQLFAKILREDGYEVVTASSGQEALVLAARARPQAILLDIVMPEMDGIATLRALRKGGHLCPVILLTARGTLQTAREAMMLGACDYITKPFDLDLVRSVLREGLRRGDDCVLEDSACGG